MTTTKIPKKLRDVAASYNYTINIVDNIAAGCVLGECDYASSEVNIASKISDERGRLRSVPDDLLIFTLAHELSHMFAYEEQAEDTNKLADQRDIIYKGKLYHNTEDTTKAKLAALRGIYKNELLTDQMAADMLKTCGIYKPGMISYVVDTHMTFHRYYQLIKTGSLCTADARRIEGLVFTPIWIAKINEKNIKIMNTFMDKHTQFRSTENAPS